MTTVEKNCVCAHPCIVVCVCVRTHARTCIVCCFEKGLTVVQALLELTILLPQLSEHEDYMCSLSTPKNF